MEFSVQHKLSVYKILIPEVSQTTLLLPENMENNTPVIPNLRTKQVKTRSILPGNSIYFMKQHLDKNRLQLPHQHAQARIKANTRN